MGRGQFGDLHVFGTVIVKWVGQKQDAQRSQRFRWRAVVRAVMNTRIPQQDDYFLTSSTTLSFSSYCNVK